MRDILRRLELVGYINLAPSRKLKQNPTIYQCANFDAEIDKSALSQINFKDLLIAPVKGRPQTHLWDYLVDTYHYLGKKPIVGRNLRQFVYVKDRPIACLAWGDPSFKLAPRDEYLGTRFMNGWSSVTHGVNNTRFLILPWVDVPNLASKNLALSVRHARRYWSEYYSIELAWAETFLDPTIFVGTCYIAANWKRVGRTVGTARSGFAARRKDHGVSKDILLYLYPEALGRIR